ncbi:hypothetical protein [Brevibacterium sp. HMSC24B04]|uniref:hypothetical protein n=1 Tax=Brevibacterium sp. HMSC24B04 TaxID=1581060 RepID=UPI0008A4E827|nr:hypothetical protein [Brevibacterium sp. HMSC24B04]OFT92678.1 hypothetical protein HMPREF3092_07230 [Brevibacterium sp. HMSC24B04]
MIIQGLDNTIPADWLTQQHVADDRVVIHLIGVLGASAFDRFARTLAKQSEHVCLLVGGLEWLLEPEEGLRHSWYGSCASELMACFQPMRLLLE